MVELSNNDNVSNNAMIRQVANGISSQSNYLETALGDRDSGMEAPGEHHYQNNDNAAVELSPTMENPRIERGSVDDCLHISSRSAEEKEGEEDIFVCTLCYSNYSSRCVDRRYPFLTNDPRDPLEIMIMEECDNTFRIPSQSQYCFFNIEDLKHHTEMHHLDPLLNESNPNLLESLYDDDDKVRTMTTTTKQFAHDPIECRTHCLPRRQWGRHLLVLNVSPFSFGVKTPLQLLSTDFKDRYQMYGCLLLLH